MPRFVCLSISATQLTFLTWLDSPVRIVTAGERFPTFSVVADEDATDRVRLEEQSRPAEAFSINAHDSGRYVLGEHHPTRTTVSVKDLEPIQDRSLVDFSQYIIQSRT